MASPEIVVSGMGAVSAAGWGEEEIWASLQHGRSGLRRLTLFDSDRCGHLPVGEVPGDPAEHSGLSAGSRSDHLAVCAAQQAMADAGLSAGDWDPGQGAVVLGALTGGMMYIEACLSRLINEDVADPSNLEQIACCNSADRVAEVFGLDGFRTTVSNACASGATAISVACDLLQGGEADVVLAGGTDSLNRVLLNGFNALYLVSPDGCRPFDRDRQGMTVGEGAGVLVLETEEHARARGARIRAYLAGRGNTCDAYHATSPRPNGDGLLEAMRQALADAGMEPNQVDYVNAHGTGTEDNDLAEARAICQLFGGPLPAVSSTKRFFGHTMAAAGAIEAMVCILALEHQAIPPNLGLREADPEVGLEPVCQCQPAALTVAMSNSLGFGGNNCAVILRRPPGD